MSAVNYYNNSIVNVRLKLLKNRKMFDFLTANTRPIVDYAPLDRANASALFFHLFLIN